ncbi:MAG TPA: glycosyl hydrolase family 8 [Polyangia bacterium]|nr:glycosyl hydrolase family 8 [Polyangia bacterium]
MIASWASAWACNAPSRTTDNGSGGSGTGTGGSASGGNGSGGSATGGTQGAGGSASGGSASGGNGAKGGTGGAGNSGLTGIIAGSTGSGGTVGSGGSGSGGVTGSGGTVGTGGAAGSPLTRGPTPPMNGTNFPFPQNRQMSNCIYPTGYDNNDVMAAYTKWKADLITSNGAGGFQRVQRMASDPLGSPPGATPLNSTVSEGIGYGMIIAVYMGDHTLFDNLWKYEQLHTDSNGLMNWVIDANGNAPVVNGQPEGGAATDADEDMAWALVMADKQWGSSGSLNYASLAKTQIQNIWKHEVYNSNLAGPGDSWPGNLYNQINISYFAPAYYRVFQQIDSGDAWAMPVPSNSTNGSVTQTVFDTIFGPNSSTPGALNSSNKNTTNGLVPAWCTSTGGMSSGQPFTYQYDSCRTPFRIGVDWCLNGTTASSAATAINPSRAQAYVALTSSFFSGVGASNIVDGYNTDGTVASSANPVSKGQSAAFLGPAAVGAMNSNSSANQTFLNAAYNLVKTNTLWIGGQYYDECWTVMSMLMMTGNFLDYTQITPAQ